MKFTEFKIGDEVKYVSGFYGSSDMNPLWESYKITGIITAVWEGEYHYEVQWANGKSNSYLPTQGNMEHLVLVKPKEKPPMNLTKVLANIDGLLKVIKNHEV